jgi:hypothetical protein
MVGENRASIFEGSDVGEPSSSADFEIRAGAGWSGRTAPIPILHFNYN